MMTDEVTSLEKAAKILGINLDEQPNIFSNGWPDRLPLNDIAKLQFPDDVNAQKELIQHAKNYIEHKTFEENYHYYVNESDSDNPILSAGGFHYYSFLTETWGNEHTLSWLKAQNWPNPKLKEVESGLDTCLDYELICEYWATGNKLFVAFYNQDELKEKIITAIQNGTLRAKVEQEVKTFGQVRPKISYVEIIDKSEILRIAKPGNSSFYYLDGNFVRITISNDDFYGWLLRSGQWPLHKDCLLNYWWDDDLHSSDPKVHLEALDYLHCKNHNGETINWNYWATREFSSSQAARLVNYIDPIEWPENDYKQGKIPDDLLKEMRRFEEWLNPKSQTWQFDTLIPALAEYSAIADKPINPPLGMVEVLGDALIDENVGSEIIATEIQKQPSTPRKRGKTQINIFLEQLCQEQDIDKLSGQSLVSAIKRFVDTKNSIEQQNCPVERHHGWHKGVCVEWKPRNGSIKGTWGKKSFDNFVSDYKKEQREKACQVVISNKS